MLLISFFTNEINSIRKKNKNSCFFKISFLFVKINEMKIMCKIYKLKNAINLKYIIKELVNLTNQYIKDLNY